MPEKTSDEYLDELLRELRAEFPGWEVRKKTEADNWNDKLYAMIWKMFGVDRSTTIGDTVWVSEGWEERSNRSKYFLLIHERMHIRQYAVYGFGSPDVGIIPFLTAYLLLPFPSYWAYYRWKSEREAYLADILARLELEGVSAARSRYERAVDKIAGKSYWYAWYSKKDIRKWFKERLPEEVT